MNHLGPPPILSPVVTPSSSHVLAAAAPGAMINYTMSGMNSTSVVPAAAAATAMVPHMAMPVSALALPTGAIQAMSVPGMATAHHFIPTSAIPTSLVQGTHQQAFPGMNFLNPVTQKQEVSLALQGSPLSLTVSSVAQNQNGVAAGQTVLANTSLAMVTSASNVVRKADGSTVSTAGLGLVQDLSLACSKAQQTQAPTTTLSQQQAVQQHAIQQVVQQQHQVAVQQQIVQVSTQPQQHIVPVQVAGQQILITPDQHQQLPQQNPGLQQGTPQQTMLTPATSQAGPANPPKKKKKKSKKKKVPTATLR